MGSLIGVAVGRKEVIEEVVDGLWFVVRVFLVHAFVYLLFVCVCVYFVREFVYFLFVSLCVFFVCVVDCLCGLLFVWFVVFVHFFIHFILLASLLELLKGVMTSTILL